MKIIPLIAAAAANGLWVWLPRSIKAGFDLLIIGWFIYMALVAYGKIVPKPRKTGGYYDRKVGKYDVNSYPKLKKLMLWFYPIVIVILLIQLIHQLGAF